MNRLKEATPLGLLFLLSFFYYSYLSAYTYTWVYTSGDSGEFMAMAYYWSAPHLYGMPLYQALSHGLAALPWSLEVTMPLILSALPAAITVVLVFMIVKKLTQNELYGAIASLILLGAAVFTTEAQVIKEYALGAMLLTGSYYFYITGRIKLAVVFIGLGTAVHMVVAAIAVLWFIIQWKAILKYIPLFALFGLAPYGLTLWELGNNSPPFIAGGGLSLSTINAYLGSTGIAGSMSVTQAPARLIREAGILLISLGFAAVPVVLGLFRPWDLSKKMLIIGIAFPIWYYLTCLDPTTWTYLSFSAPFLAIAAGLGLKKLKTSHINLVLAGVLALILTNAYMLDSGRLNSESPDAQEYLDSIASIPDKSVIVAHRGGFYGSGLFYAMSQGKDVIPVYFRYENEKNILWWQYADWVNRTYPLDGNSTQTMMLSALEKDIGVYALLPLMEGWPEVLKIEDYNSHFGRVTGVEDTAVYSPLWHLENDAIAETQ